MIVDTTFGLKHLVSLRMLAVALVLPSGCHSCLLWGDLGRGCETGPSLHHELDALTVLCSLEPPASLSPLDCVSCPPLTASEWGPRRNPELTVPLLPFPLLKLYPGSKDLEKVFLPDVISDNNLRYLVTGPPLTSPFEGLQG